MSSTPTDRKAATVKIGGNVDYAKVAERLKLFREDNPHGKQESTYNNDMDGSTIFTVYLWKDKTDLLDLMKAGVTDKDALRSSADANGTAKGTPGKDKDFEKLESIALGRALGMLGYLASGEIASFEEMEEYNKYKKQQHQEAVTAAIEAMEAATTMTELKDAFIASKLMFDKEVFEAKEAMKLKLEAAT